MSSNQIHERISRSVEKRPISRKAKIRRLRSAYRIEGVLAVIGKSESIGNLVTPYRGNLCFVAKSLLRRVAKECNFFIAPPAGREPEVIALVQAIL